VIPATRPISLVLVLAVTGCSPRSEVPELHDYGPFRDFELTAANGEPFDTKSLRGAPMLLFFGYTSCPDVCPTTLSRLGEATRLARAEGHAATAVFVSVDPAFDTPQRMTEYLEFFDFPGVGLTGAREEIETAMRTSGIFAERTPTADGGYLVDHTVSVLLVDGEGRLRSLFGPGDSPRRIADAIARLD
jgi:protein SCO1/2